jgi:hypothetical protein
MGIWAGSGSLGRRRVRIPLALGRVPITVSAPVGLAEPARSTFRDLVRDPAGEPGLSVRIQGGGRRRPRVSAPGFRAEPSDTDTAVDQLVELLLRVALTREAGRLHLHAGHVTRDGRGVLVAGADGVGKSTLVAQLVLEGFDYFTDEMVAVDRALAVSSFPKPLSLTAGVFRDLAALDPRTTGAGAASPAIWHVPATAVRPGCLATGGTPVALAFVRHRAGARLQVDDLRPTAAARWLLADSPDAAGMGADGMRIAAALCATLRCAEVTFGDGAEAIGAIRQLVDAGPTAPSPVSWTPAAEPDGPLRAQDRAPATPPTPITPSAVLARAPQVSVATVGDRALAWNPAGPGGPEVIELDEPTTVWLQLLDGEAELGAIAREVAAANGLPAADLVETVCALAADLAASGLVVTAR